MSSDDRIKSFLSDLGRATLRGVRRCPKCGTYNGTRGLSCKKCNCLFKEKRKFNSNTEACKLVTGNSTQIFSVRVHDKGPDYRGFVQLPLALLQNKILPQGVDSFVLSETALCFVDSCQRLFDTSILKCHENETDQCLITPMCQHIETAIKCSNEASVLDIKDSVLSILNVSNDIKQELYQLVAQSSAPLVQRVSKNVMAVKCQVSPKHPLGYLHFSLFNSKVKEKVDERFYCTCHDFKSDNKRNQFKSNLLVSNRKCVHYYACISALGSDVKLADEFSAYVNLESNFRTPLFTADEPLSMHDNQLVSMLNNDLVDASDVCNIEIEVLNDNALLDNANMSISEVIDANIQVQNLEINANGEVTIVSRGLSDNSLQISDLHDNLCFPDIELNPSVEIIPLKKVKIEDRLHKSIKTCRANKKTVVQNVPSTLLKPVEKKPIKKPVLLKQDTSTSEEKRTNMPFIQWLASVAERINQSMHYQFNGKPDDLIFHIPQVFFDCLRERISCGGTKKRLPNQTKAFFRKDAVPLGTFTKYTWKITNILHLKQIFETPLIPLEVTRSFVQNRDGTYDPYTLKGDENDDLKNDGLIPIKPLELKTYLKVGNTSRNQIEPTPFIIEWIPDILPVSKIGELRIRFEYGHQKINGVKLVRIPKNSHLPCVRQ